MMNTLLRLLRHQYLAAVPQRHWKWSENDGDVVDIETLSSERFQWKVIENILSDELVIQYPRPPASHISFLKAYISLIESSSPTTSILDPLYEYLTAALSCHFTNESEPLPSTYKSYWLGGETYVTLAESTSLLSLGTTGLSTWAAAMRLAEFVIECSECDSNNSFTNTKAAISFRNRRVLELGCGCGLGGFASIAAGKAAGVVLTDVNSNVLATVRRSIGANGMDRDTNIIDTRLLDWRSITRDAILNREYGHLPDIILAADVVFDELLVPDLVRTLELFLSARDGAVAVVSSTIRNDQTFHCFTSALDTAALKVKSLPAPTKRLFYDFDDIETYSLLLISR